MVRYANKRQKAIVVLIFENRESTKDIAEAATINIRTT